MQRFPLDYPNTRIVISTRPETEINGFGTFKVLNINPMSLNNAIELIDKTEYNDKQKRDLFRDKIQSGLYEEKKSFASNPLLCLLMLICFNDNNDIPERAALFYDEAFNTLYSRHDFSKGPFNRNHRSGLHKDEFREVFRLFCYRTLAKHKISFSQMEFTAELSRSAVICEKIVDSDNLQQDLMENVCLLQRDGGKIHFIHRSFQEFFAAEFLSVYRADDLLSVFDRLLSDPIASKVSTLLYDIDPKVIEEYWILPKLTDIIQVLFVDGDLTKPEQLSHIFSGFDISDEDNTINSLSFPGDVNFMFLQTIFGEIYGIENLQNGFDFLTSSSMSPPGFENLREYISEDPESPKVWKSDLSKEILKKSDAFSTRRSMSVQKKWSWQVDVSDSDFDSFMSKTILPDWFSKTSMQFADLYQTVSARVKLRQDIDLLN